MKVNVTLKELKRCVKFAKKHGVSKHKTITLTHGLDCAIGNSLGVAANWNDKPKNITDYEAW
jgi:hypothetical protein